MYIDRSMQRLAPSHRDAEAAPIPVRIPPLAWRQPFFIWTPAATALALGWPALALRGQSGLFETSLTAGAIGVAAALVSLGVAWVVRRPPRTRVTVVRHILICVAVAAIAAPFVLTWLLQGVAELKNGTGADNGLGGGAAWAMQPLALMLGLPIALFSGLVFSWVALTKTAPRTKPKAPRQQRASRRAATPERARDVQPFY